MIGYGFYAATEILSPDDLFLLHTFFFIEKFLDKLMG